MKKAIVVLVCLALIVLAGCSSQSQAESAMRGIYQRITTALNTATAAMTPNATLVSVTAALNGCASTIEDAFNDYEDLGDRFDLEESDAIAIHANLADSIEAVQNALMEQERAMLAVVAYIPEVLLESRSAIAMIGEVSELLAEY